MILTPQKYDRSMTPPQMRKNPEDYLLYKYRVLYRLKESIKRQPKYKIFSSKAIIHRQASHEIPHLDCKKLTYLLYLANHKFRVRLPNQMSGINAVRHSKGLLSLTTKFLPTSPDLLASF